MNAACQKKVLVLGCGNFGICLAQHLAKKGYAVSVWTRNVDLADHLNRYHFHPNYHVGIELSENIHAISRIEKIHFEGSEAVILAVPTQSLRELLQGHKDNFSGQLLVSTAKGIEITTQHFPLAIIGEIWGEAAKKSAVVLSGPSFAAEVISGQPTAVSLASNNWQQAKLAQEVFHAPYFRAYTSNDPVGLEVAGALKNIIAIAAGACAGMGFGQNSQAALLTRGLAEITRIGVCLGADPITFSGLGGVGDLILTCTSHKSRNYSVGFGLGKGEPLDSILASMNSVAEGVYSATAAAGMVKRFSIATPILDQVFAVLYQGKSVFQALDDLLERGAKKEVDLPAT